MQKLVNLLFGLIVGVLIGSLFLPKPPQPKVICEDGAEYADESLIRDPYYKYSIACNLGDANGPAVIVEIID